MTTADKSVQAISVIVPKNPFTPTALEGAQHCLAALDVEKLMEWWPGTPHSPHRNANKVKSIQRSLDWRRVAQIASYLLQREIVEAPQRLDEFFGDIYEPRKNEPGREWPPRVPVIVGYERSEYPTFSNVLLHVNGAKLKRIEEEQGAGRLIFSEADPKLHFSVIDGQHRINGAFLAVRLLKQDQPGIRWEIPAEVFVDLDLAGKPPRRQAQIFIDVNFYQKKVDRSLVADLFPTARGDRGPLDDKERAQDLGRRLMLESGPLVGMVQIPGVKFGVKDVVTLATLNGAIEDILPYLRRAGLEGLDSQTAFLAQSLTAWLDATNRREEVGGGSLDPENVAYQGRVLVSFLTLVPACIFTLLSARVPLVSDQAGRRTTDWLRRLMKRAGLLAAGRFIPKSKFKTKGFLGSGGLARFRDTLWAAALAPSSVARFGEDRIASLARAARGRVEVALGP